MIIQELIDMLNMFPNREIPIDFYNTDSKEPLFFNGIGYDGDDLLGTDATGATFYLQMKSSN